MQEKIVSAVEKAIDQLITTFQDNPKRVGTKGICTGYYFTI